MESSSIINIIIIIIINDKKKTKQNLTFGTTFIATKKSEMKIKVPKKNVNKKKIKAWTNCELQTQLTETNVFRILYSKLEKNGIT